MTISSTVRRAGPFDGNGVTTAFPFSFKIFSKTDIQVLLTAVNGAVSTLVLDSDYSVTMNADQNNTPGGFITYPISGSPLPGGAKLVLIGALPYDQPADITNSGGFYPQVIEDALDREEIQIQQLAEIASRAVTFPVSETIDATLPIAAQRASSVYGFDANGAPILLPMPTSVGAGDLKIEEWADGIDYTAGVSSSVTLSRAYGIKANLGSVVMQGATQDPASYSLSGDGRTLIFDSMIPAGVTRIWCIGGTTLSVPTSGALFEQDMPGAVQRTYQSRFADTVHVKDFGEVVTNTTLATAVTALQSVGGGTLKLTRGDYSAISLPTDYSGVVIDYDGPNIPVTVFGESPGASYVAQKALLYKDNTAHAGHGHTVLHIGNKVRGTGNIGVTNADFGLVVSLLKDNFNTGSAQAGEMDCAYFAARNDGSNSDTTGFCIDIGNYGVGFNALFEGNCYDFDSNTIAHGINNQAGVVDTRTGNYYGYVVQKNAGNGGVALLAVNNGGKFQHLLQFSGSGAVRFDMPIDSNDTVTMRMVDASLNSKTIRVFNNALSVVNNAGNSEIFQLADNGTLTVPGLSTGVGLFAGAPGAGTAGALSIGNGSSATASAGGQPLPSNPAGFLNMYLSTTAIRIPYYLP